MRLFKGQYAFANKAASVIFIILIGWIYLYFWHNLPEDYANYKRKYIQSSIHFHQSENLSPQDLKRVEKLFEYQLSIYRSRLNALNNNLKIQTALVILSLMLIVRRSKDDQSKDNLGGNESKKDGDDSLEVSGMRFPIKLLHFFVPAALLYSWLEFGFLFHELVDLRIVSWLTLDALKDPQNDVILSARSLFNDSALLDAWFVLFAKDYHQITPGAYGGFSSAVLLSVVYGLLFGSAHACNLSMIYLAQKRYITNPSLRNYVRAFLVFAAILIAFTHLQFAFGGAHRNWFQFAIALWTAALIYGNLKLDELIKKEMPQ